MQLPLLPFDCSEARENLEVLLLDHNRRSLSNAVFLVGWSSLFFLNPGLHPDAFNSPSGGWPKRLKPIAAEAWRRYEAGQFTEDEFYCYEACKARYTYEAGVVVLSPEKRPWLFVDHFAA